jgi:hypothetical protein
MKSLRHVAWGFVVLAWRGMRSGGILTRNDYRTGKKGTHGRKNPLPVILLRRGCPHTRHLETTPHGALRSREASPSQSSSLQGLLPHRSSYQEALGLHTYD